MADTKRNTSPCRNRRAVAAACVMACSSGGAQTQVPADTPSAETTPAKRRATDLAPQFDLGILKERGLNPAIAEYFRTIRGFDAGEQTVQLTVNGAALGRKLALFDVDGHLCFTPPFVQAIGLVPMDGSLGPPGSTTGGGVGSPMAACPDYRAFSPRALVKLQPNLLAVDLTVPIEFVQAVPKAYRTDYGGLGGMLNYRGYGMNSKAVTGAESGAYRYRYLDTTLGFNIDDWMFRSRQDYSDSNGLARFNWRSAYVQKTFESWRQVLQAGFITSLDPMFGGLTITGAQWFPERALYAKDSNYPITGVATTRSRLEIRQNGILLFNTVVPPGPFTVTDYPLQNRGADLDVRLIEENGAVQSFSVPASSLLLAAGNAQYEGWNLAGGTYWDQTRNHVFRNAPLASASHGWAHGPFAGTLGGLVSREYLAAGAAARVVLGENRPTVFGQVLASHDAGRSFTGMLGSVATGVALGPDIQVGASGNLRTARYRGLQEALAYQQITPWIASGYRSQLGATMSWNAGTIGGFALGVTRENYFYGSAGHIATFNWNKSWQGGITLNVGVAHRTARQSPLDVLGLQPGEVRLPGSNYFYTTLSIPLGHGISSRTFAQRNDGFNRYGTGIEQRVNEFFGYRASVEEAEGLSGKGRGTSLSAYGTPYYTSVGGGVSRVRNYESTYAELSGGVVATGDGVGFSPYQIQDSFGTVRTGDVIGARIETSQGPVWSGLTGIAALAALAPYQESRIELGGTSVPLNIEVNNGLMVVQTSRGAVVQLNMDMRRVRRVLLIVTRTDGSALPSGAIILRGGNEYFTASTDEGRVLIAEMNPGEVLVAQMGDGASCTIGEIVPLPKNDDDLFEMASAQCK